MIFRPRLSSLLPGLLAAFAGAGNPAQAQDPIGASPDITWSCWHNGQTRILCRLAVAPSDDLAEAPEVTYPEQTRLTATARQIRDQPAALRGRTLVIPMFSHPESMLNAMDLADAVMCGGREHCRVDFASGVDALAALDVDPALE